MRLFLAWRNTSHPMPPGLCWGLRLSPTDFRRFLGLADPDGQRGGQKRDNLAVYIESTRFWKAFRYGFRCFCYVFLMFCYGFGSQTGEVNRRGSTENKRWNVHFWSCWAFQCVFPMFDGYHKQIQVDARVIVQRTRSRRPHRCQWVFLPRRSIRCWASEPFSSFSLEDRCGCYYVICFSIVQVLVSEKVEDTTVLGVTGCRFLDRFGVESHF